MSSKDEFEKDKIEAAFYAAVESEWDEEDLDDLSLKDALVTVTFVDGTGMEFHGVDSNRLVANLAALGYAQMMDATGARVTIFAHNIVSLVAEGSQHSE